jgi:hypothetical protein
MTVSHPPRVSMNSHHAASLGAHSRLQPFNARFFSSAPISGEPDALQQLVAPKSRGPFRW